MGYRVGIDLVAVGTIEAALRDHGDGYLERVFTAEEAAQAAASPARAARLAERFAAKEAVAKILRPDAGTPLPWTTIEVHSESGSRPTIVLTAEARALAAASAISGFSVSLSLAGEYALAVVIAGSPGLLPIMGA